MKIILFGWRALSVVVAIDWTIYGILFAGAWAGLVPPPNPALSTQAIVFVGGAMLMFEQAFPTIRKWVDR